MRMATDMPHRGAMHETAAGAFPRLGLTGFGRRASVAGLAGIAR